MRQEVDARAVKCRIDRLVLRGSGKGQEQQEEERDGYARQRHSQQALAIADSDQFLANLLKRGSCQIRQVLSIIGEAAEK
jgi:hypothetical protein